MPATTDLTARAERFKSLKGGQMVNNVVMESYLELLVRRGASDNRYPLVYAVDTHWQSESERTTAIAARQSIEKLCAASVVLFPIHHPDSLHWSACAIDKKHKIVLLYDSLGTSVVEAKRHMTDCIDYWFLLYKLAGIKDPVVDEDRFTFRAYISPRQTNNNACGIYALRALELFSRGQDLGHGDEGLQLGFEPTKKGEEWMRERILAELMFDSLFS